MLSSPSTRPIVIIGAGPAGLTAAYALAARGVKVVVREKDRQVGGLARTVEYRGYRFDIGGHRFFTKVDAVRRLWRSMLGADFLTRPRLSRIYYDGRFFDYPLRPMNALRGLGPWNAALIVLSYAWMKLRPIRPEVSFEDWVSNRFGRRLYRTFFKTYTEKVWGIPCHTIGAQWAAQRIKGLSLWTAVMNMLFDPLLPGRRTSIKTLIDSFEYPRLGPGMMWEAFVRRITELGGEVRLGSGVTRLVHDGARIVGIVCDDERPERVTEVEGVISTMPLRELIGALSPPAPQQVREAAARLTYRDFITVALIVDQAHVFPDNWIYVHDPSVKLGRIQNFKNWSPDMVPDPRYTCLGLEYFCSEGDDVWRMSDAELLELGRRDVGALRLVDPTRVIDGTVVRVPKAYPVYDAGFAEAVDLLRLYLARFPNLQPAGRNGMHKYNNQDHSMVTALLAAGNLLGQSHDPWGVNADDEYHEEIDLRVPGLLDDLTALEGTQPLVPMPVDSRPSR